MLMMETIAKIRLFHFTHGKAIKQICFGTFAGVGFLVDRHEAHQPHEPTDALLVQPSCPSMSTTRLKPTCAVMTRQWKMRADHRSPRYTTRFSDLPVVR
ncbi:DUF4113 domain-containing protein [Yoonia sp.]|uniref:DUF4113 domain-containing protein n=1 Tax=Yoonia sp. TaxID=2212373 RepID=UPI00397594B7